MLKFSVHFCFHTVVFSQFKTTYGVCYQDMCWTKANTTDFSHYFLCSFSQKRIVEIVPLLIKLFKCKAWLKMTKMSLDKFFQLALCDFLCFLISYYNIFIILSPVIHPMTLRRI